MLLGRPNTRRLSAALAALLAVAGVAGSIAVADAFGGAPQEASAATVLSPTAPAGVLLTPAVVGAAATRDGDTDADVHTGPSTPVVTSAPATTETDAPEPDTPEPRASGPDASAPDTAAPHASEPHTSGSDASAPDTAAPDTAAPHASDPDASDPDASDPHVSAPDASASGAAPVVPTVVSAGDVAGAGSLDSPATGAEPAVRLGGARSGLPWASGVYVPGSQPAGYQRFADWRGRPLDVAVFWVDRQTWSDMIDSWTFDAWRDVDVTKVIGIPPFPVGVGASLAECATGAYADEWRELAANVADAGLAGSTIVRLGWEMNGDWYPWSAWNPQEFVACWRSVVGAAESVAPQLRWDWNVNAGVGKSVAHPQDAYPGDEWVDIIGVDSYDNWPMATTQQAWQTGQYGGAYRLAYWLDFARAHGKQLSIPEWGGYLVPGVGEQGRSDNPFYIDAMVDFFAANARDIAYESYFNEPHSYHLGALFEPVQLPLSSEAYLDRYRPT